jgi:broad specificity phosphatase PhoE
VTGKQETTIYIVRHAEVHNPQQILYGRLPRFGLSDLGWKQAERTARLLAKEPVTAIYSSPQLRARQTARIIAEYHPELKIQTTRVLAEVVTSWQGRPYTDLHNIDFDFYSHPLNPDDETVQQVWERVRTFVERVRRRHAGQAVVAVTHGDLTFAARAGYAGMPIDVASIRGRNIYPGHASLTKLTFCPKDDTYPSRLEYFDPNGSDGRWSRGWVKVPSEGLLKEPAVPEPGGPPWILTSSGQ